MSSEKRRVLVLQHTDHEHLGRIADALEQEEVGYTYLRADRGDSIPSDLEGYHGLIVMGGPQSVYEEEEFSFLKPEKALIQDAILKKFPVLGVCLGSQLLAEALGSRVYPGSYFELGWRKVNLSRESQSDFVLGHLPRAITPFHWHGDVFDLPEGATPIGSSEFTALQGFVWNRRVYGLVFHLEVTLDQVEGMVVDFPGDLAKSGIDQAAVLGDAPVMLEALQAPSIEVFRRWTQLL